MPSQVLIPKRRIVVPKKPAAPSRYYLTDSVLDKVRRIKESKSFRALGEGKYRVKLSGDSDSTEILARVEPKHGGIKAVDLYLQSGTPVGKFRINKVGDTDWMLIHRNVSQEFKGYNLGRSVEILLDFY
ncbi:MAG: hypothetical protein NTY48_01940 [Candidatus Diapherotrites archaeon]|nr:hypothetical protein [Candidatus Diapherotrites archaeon]